MIEAKIIDGGIDWLTLTAAGATENRDALHSLAVEFLAETSREGAPIREQAPQGFHGMGNEHVFWGIREERLMVKSYGKAANELAGRIRRAGITPRCTRIDTQITADYPQRPANWAAARREQVRQAEERLPTNMRRERRLYEAGDCDTGITIGARTGDIHRRIYDPYRRGHYEYPQTAIRFEVEFKHDTARTVFATMMQTNETQYAAAAYVQGECMKVGLEEPWFQAQEVPVLPSTYKPTDNEKRLRWLRDSVEPALLKLLSDAEYRPIVERWFRDVRDRATVEHLETVLKLEHLRQAKRLEVGE